MLLTTQTNEGASLVSIPLRYALVSSCLLMYFIFVILLPMFLFSCFTISATHHLCDLCLNHYFISSILYPRLSYFCILLYFVSAAFCIYFCLSLLICFYSSCLYFTCILLIFNYNLVILLNQQERATAQSSKRYGALFR